MDMKEVIAELYMIEDEENNRQCSTKMLSIAVEMNHASMLRAIADRFGKSLSAFAGEILEDITKEAFLHLTDDDRKALAVKADQETTDLVLKSFGAPDAIHFKNHDGELTKENRYWQTLVEVWEKADQERGEGEQ